LQLKRGLLVLSLNLSSDILFFHFFAFKFNLCRYTEGVAAAEAQRMSHDAEAALKLLQADALQAVERAKEAEATAAVQLKDAWAMPEPGGAVQVGMQLTRSLQAPGFNP
jgi:hypothetical protein